MSSQHSNTYDVATGHFSSLLRHWRNVRRLTQIELAGDANVSARHLCFLETGRAQPSREMVQLLGGALDLPLEERNARCTWQQASCRLTATGAWRLIICSTCARRSISFFGNKSHTPVSSSMDIGTSAFAMKPPDVCSKRFTSRTKWNPTLRITPCTWFSIQKACGSSL